MRDEVSEVCVRGDDGDVAVQTALRNQGVGQAGPAAVGDDPAPQLLGPLPVLGQQRQAWDDAEKSNGMNELESTATALTGLL